VRDGNDRPLKFREVALQPPYALGIKVIGRLVQQQHVRLLEQEAAERHPPPLASGNLAHVGFSGGKPQRVHRHIDLVVQLPEAERIDALLQVSLLLQQTHHLVVAHRLGEAGADLVELIEDRLLLRNSIHDVPANVLGGIECRLLRQKPDLRSRKRSRVSQKILVHACHDAQEGRLSRAVAPEHADLGAREE
jgi:hypothetical protein